MTPVPLADALTVLLPSAADTRFLRACLRGDPAEGGAPPDHPSPPLAPLGHDSLKGWGSRAAPAPSAYLRAAALGEEVRWREYARISQETLLALEAAGVTPAVAGGPALAEIVYPRAAARHCDSLVLLVRDQSDLETARCLERHGFPMEREQPACELVLRHPSGIRITVRRGLFASPIFRLPVEAVWDRTKAAEVTGAPARILSPADTLLQLCVDGLVGTVPRTALWAADAWYVLDRSADLSWEAVGDAARRADAELPLVVALSYLSEALAAPVPPPMLATLGTAAARASRAARSVCLYATRKRPSVPVRRLLGACRTWRSRALLAGWLLCPAPETLRLHEPGMRDLPLPAAYAARLVRIAVSRARAKAQPAPARRRAGQDAGRSDVGSATHQSPRCEG